MRVFEVQNDDDLFGEKNVTPTQKEFKNFSV